MFDVHLAITVQGFVSGALYLGVLVGLLVVGSGVGRQASPAGGGLVSGAAGFLIAVAVLNQIAYYVGPRFLDGDGVMWMHVGIGLVGSLLRTVGFVGLILGIVKIAKREGTATP